MLEENRGSFAGCGSDEAKVDASLACVECGASIPVEDFDVLMAEQVNLAERPRCNDCYQSFETEK